MSPIWQPVLIAAMWPVVALTLGFVFRDPIRGLLERLSKSIIRYRELEILLDSDKQSRDTPLSLSDIALAGTGDLPSLPEPPSSFREISTRALKILGESVPDPGAYRVQL